MTSRQTAKTILSLAVTTGVIAVVAVSTATLAPAQADDGRAAVSAAAGTIVWTAQGIGAQVYECKADGHAGLAWSFREPVATLVSGGKTIGRHFAGPSWEMADGSLVVGKVVAPAPGTSADDIPWLKLEVSEHRGSGLLGDVTSVQRLATVGGRKSGPCTKEGTLVAEPYEATYVFARP